MQRLDDLQLGAVEEDVGVALAHEDDALAGQLVRQLGGAQKLASASVGDGVQDEVGLLGLAVRIADLHAIGLVDLGGCGKGREGNDQRQDGHWKANSSHGNSPVGGILFALSRSLVEGSLVPHPPAGTGPAASKVVEYLAASEVAEPTAASNGNRTQGRLEPRLWYPPPPSGPKP